MTQKSGFLQSTIGRKQLVALTGLGISLFVLGHMAGNLLMFVSPQAYNEYGHAIISNKLIYAIELGLAAAFLGHAFVALRLQFLNRGARPQRYAMTPNGEKKPAAASQTMAIQGTILLVFIILHLRTFKYGPYYEVDYGQGPIRDLFRLMAEVFQGPGYVAWYVVAMIVLGLHLSHGIRSLLQTVGVHHPQHQGKIKCLAYGYALLVSIGFISQPIFMLFFYKGS
ncbi:MAG: succinate dehydrogenase cytochrome b subunit [Bdellovibrionales bacterium]